MPREVVPQTPLSLLLRVGRGEQAAWEEFYGLYAPIVFKLARVRGLDHQAAQDVVSRVMERLAVRMKSGFKVDHGRGLFRNYLRTVTRNAIGSLVKRRKSLPAQASDLPSWVGGKELAPEDEFARLERVERLRLCVERIRKSGDVSPRDLAAFQHYVLQDEPAKKVAKLFELRPQRVYDIKQEVLERLRKMLIKLDLELGEV